MNKDVFGTIMFMIGAGIGSAVTYFVAKFKNDQKREQEVQQFIATLKKEAEPQEEEEVKQPEVVEPPKEEKVNYAKVKADYVPEPDAQAAPPKFADKGKKKARTDKLFKNPYVIEDYEFDEDNDYRKITLTYYKDGKLVDEIGSVVEAQPIIGDALQFFGESDSLYVRNERIRCDYEVLKDNGTFSDVVAKKPNLADSDEDDE